MKSAGRRRDPACSAGTGRMPLSEEFSLMSQPQEATLTAILNGLTERHSFMLATGPDPRSLAQALFGIVSNLAPMVRAILVQLSDVPPAASPAGDKSADAPLTLHAVAALILGKPVATREIDDVEHLLNRLTRPVDSETRAVLILGGADRLRADSFAYLRMAAELTSRTGFQLHVVFVGGPQFPQLLTREGGQLAERAVIRPAVSTAVPADKRLTEPPAPEQPRQPLVAWQNATPPVGTPAPDGWMSRLRRRLRA
jgi:hypothetical protein